MAVGPVIELEGVEFGYEPVRAGGGVGGVEGAFALRVERLRVEAGERVACIGASGAGKTTLVSVIGGVVGARRGRVSVLGVDLTGLGEQARQALRLARIGVVFQELELLEYLTAMENIVVARWLGRSGSGLEEEARRLAVRTGVAHRLHAKPGALSQGERQRVGLCRALVTRPELILCDEPTGNLDPESTRAVLDLLFEETARTGAAMVMVTHNHGLLARFDRVVEVVEREGGEGRRSVVEERGTGGALPGGAAC